LRREEKRNESGNKQTIEKEKRRKETKETLEVE
jgi:hypothetical protein